MLASDLIYKLSLLVAIHGDCQVELCPDGDLDDDWAMLEDVEAHHTEGCATGQGVIVLTGRFR